VIPAFNEASRLPETLATLQDHFQGMTTQFIVVDDGSTDDTYKVATNFAASGFPISVVRLDRNRGKGAAVRTGIALTTGHQVLIMDADLATDLDALKFMMQRIEEVDIVIGSRSVPGSMVKSSSWTRSVMGRSFNRLVRLVLRLQIHDSQCGFKLFRGDVARRLFAMSQVDGFAFDAELLLIAKILGCSVAEVPVTWTAVKGSSVRPVRDSFKSAGAIIVIWFRLRPAKVRRRAQALGWPPV